MSELDHAREEIAEADRQIAAYFVRRMEAVREVAAYKRAHGLPVLDAQQEKNVLARCAQYVDDPALRDSYLLLMKEAMALSRRYQHRLLEGVRVAYSGVPGAFAHIAARRIFPDGEAVAHGQFEEAYAAVARGECDCAVLPIENSYAGEVGPVIDLMFDGDLYVNGVYDLPVTQNLLALPGASLGDIAVVRSHPQALSQCAGYIRRHGWRIEEASNTAAAARSVAEAGDVRVAAIASAETAALYGLAVLDHDIHESALNTTRFAVFSRAEHTGAPREGGNFILLFAVRHVAGALAQALAVIGEHGFNMKALRSRPMRGEPWRYYFYVEAEGDERSEAGQRMLAALADHCERLKVVGHYAAQIPLGKGEDA